MTLPFLQASQFIGRQRELGLLLSALASATKGSGQSILIGGESGIGKSRLFHEVKTRAEVQGTLVITGQAITESTAPYYLWRECFRWLAILVDVADEEASLLKSVVPDLATLIERDIPDLALNEPQAFQQRLHELIISLFQRHGQPLVILFEDLQWAKEEDMALLAYLTKSAESLPLLILGNYRDDELPLLPSRLPSMKAMKIQRLNEAEIAALSEMMLGQSQPTVVALLINQTEGNVYFLVEIVRALAEEAGQLEDVGNRTLPPRIFTVGIQQIVERRLSQIPPADRELLELAAVLGRQLDLPVLRITVSALELDRWLGACAALAVLEVNDNRWRFVHDKLREGVLNNLDQARSRRLHRRAATAIETAYQNDDSLAARLAFHWKMADNPETEAHYALIAARLAQSIFATHEANALYTQALEALERLPDTLENRRIRVDAIILRAQITLTLVKPNKYLEQLDSAERLVYSISPSRDADDMDAADQGRVSKIHLQIGHAHFGISNLPEAIKHYTEALRIGQNLGNEALIAPSAAVLGRIYAVQGRYIEAEILLRSASQLLQKLKLIPQWSRTMQIFAFARGGRGYYHEGIEILTNVRERARQIKDFSAVVFTHTSASGIHTTVAGDLEAAIYDAEQGIEVARSLRDLTSLYIPYGYAAWAETRRGNHQIAIEYCANATSIANHFGGLLLWTESFYYVEAEVTFNAGKREEAIALCAKALDYAVKVFSVMNEVRTYNLLGVIYADTNIVQSDAYFSKAIQIAEPYDLRMEEMNARVNWGKALLKRGATQTGHQHLELALAQFHASNLPIRIAEVHTLLRQP